MHAKNYTQAQIGTDINPSYEVYMPLLLPYQVSMGRVVTNSFPGYYEGPGCLKVIQLRDGGAYVCVYL